jgi:hypothetical protein
MSVERFEPTLEKRESGTRGDAIASPKARQQPMGRLPPVYAGSKPTRHTAQRGFGIKTTGPNWIRWF